MVIEYRVTDFVFDKDAWARALENAVLQMGQSELARLLSVSEAAVWHWRNKQYSPPFEYPSMTNFLRVCNMLDLSPAVFFVLENWE